nr:hypothetical protein Q903MT_gene1531 [Picea sitchensis]
MRKFIYVDKLDHLGVYFGSPKRDIGLNLSMLLESSCFGIGTEKVLLRAFNICLEHLDSSTT